MTDVLLVSRRLVKATRDYLKEKGFLDASKEVMPVSRDEYAIAITTDAKEIFCNGDIPEGCVISNMMLPLATTKMSPHQLIYNAVASLLPQQPLEGLPRHWIKHGDLVVFPSSSFSGPHWENVGSELWKRVAGCLGARRLAIEGHVSNDDYRTPTCCLLLGDNGLVEHVDNKVRYVFNVTKNMFCHGNITEKIRMSQLSCNDETVLDLFAGIGYFTLPLLVHTTVRRVHSCDWSHDAIDALHKGLVANHVVGRCITHCMDCRELQLSEQVDRVILGLIPSSRCGYQTACRHINTSTGGWLHIHGTVSSKGIAMGTVTKKRCWDDWGREVCEEIKQLLHEAHNQICWTTTLSHVEHVKSYAPHIDHVVVDIVCRPCCHRN